MSGIFIPRVNIFNRAPTTLFVMFDGERSPIPPGISELPQIALRHAENQNPIMGSGDPYNPGAMGTKYLIVVEGEDGWMQPLTKEEWEDHLQRPCRDDENIWFEQQYGNDPKAKLQKRGSRNAVHARNRSDAGGPLNVNAEFTAREA